VISQRESGENATARYPERYPSTMLITFSGKGHRIIRVRPGVAATQRPEG
jgi:hypothetical protein